MQLTSSVKVCCVFLCHFVFCFI